MAPYFVTLENGLRVILIDTKAYPTLTSIILFGAGSRYENQKNNGIAHFFEHILFKGSKKYPSSFAIASLLEGMGAVNNAFTAKDYTGYWVKGTVGHFDRTADILADMIMHPLLKPEEIEREKGVIVEEINMYEDSPGRKVGDLFENLLYAGNSLGSDTTGTKETVTNFTRKTFLDYMHRLYKPENAVLVIAGGLNLEVGQKGKSNPAASAIFKIIKEKFGKWAAVQSGQGKTGYTKVREIQKNPQILVRQKKTEQTHFILGYRTFSRFDSRRYALSVLSTILGGGMSSRLFIEVRERRGLCYYISTHREAYADVGYLATQAGVPNDPVKIKKAIEVIMAEHGKIAQGRVGEEEIVRAKEMIKGRILLSMEDSSSVATWYGTKAILEDRIETVEEIINKIGKVNRAEIIETAQKLVKPDRLNLAVIGPYDRESLRGQSF